MTEQEDVGASTAAREPAGLGEGLLGVCAIGASAGGLEALERFFAAVPERTGIAWVVIQHLSPDYRSLMAELLTRHTRLPVKRAENGMRLEPDTIFLNPPKSDLTVEAGILRLAEHPVSAGLHLPIDTFFAALGQDFGDRAVGVVLSGTGSDGTRGARELKAEGGLVLAQDAGEAQFDGMPRSVTATGLADQVLLAGAMAGVIVQFLSREATLLPPVHDLRDTVTGEQLQRVLSILRDSSGIDFTGYKPSTIVRRIERRIQMHPGLDLERYAALLRQSPAELQALHRDLLINVTRFFRDGEAFGLLESTVVPQLLRDAPRDRELRVWIPACSTGEEPYSIAMLLIEAMAAAGDPRELRIFATDVDMDAVETASAGWYPESIAADVAGERLARFFTREGDGYKVTRALRDRVIFARHNVLRDPPLTRMDLVSCRNMLIYLGQEQQRRVLALLAYALRAKGFLFLGPSESVGPLSNHFHVVDSKWRIFQALHPGRQTLVESFPARPRVPGMPVSASDGFTGAPPLRGLVPGRSGEDILLDRVYQELAGALQLRCVVLDADNNLVHAFGDVRDLLTVPPGRSTLEISRMLPKPLAAAVRTALGRAAKEREEVAYRGIDNGPGRPTITVRVRAIEHGDRSRLFLVFFQDGPEPLSGTTSELTADNASVARIGQLEQELQYTKEHLQATIEELETSNEELQATNEELIASNEELQSTNEELQSVNEELQTVNAEHQEKILELVALNNDIENLLHSTGVGIVFLDHDLHIRKFTDDATRVLHVLPQDIGRPIGHIASPVPGLDLEAMARRVMASGTSESAEFDLPDGTMMHLRMLPYLTREPGVHGAMLSVVDATEIKRGQKRLQSILDALPASVAVVRQDGTILQTNAAWAEFAADNAAPAVVRSGVGLNYLDVCGADPADVTAREAAAGIRAVLHGEREQFRMEYPCDSPTKKRWFVMDVRAIAPDGSRGAVIQHTDVSEARLRVDELEQALRGAASAG